MAIPVLLVLGAPITLGPARDREAHRRQPGRLAEWILLLVHSRVSRPCVTNPIVAAVLFASSLWVFYYTPLFRWATENHVGHTWMVVHFLITGYLFVQTLIGIDPVAGRPSYPLRLRAAARDDGVPRVLRAVADDGHGAAARRLVRRDGAHLGSAAARRSAGGRRDRVERRRDPDRDPGDRRRHPVEPSDTRESKRHDRKADRDGDAELNAYNAMLEERGAPQVAVAARAKLRS